VTVSLTVSDRVDHVAGHNCTRGEALCTPPPPPWGNCRHIPENQRDIISVQARLDRKKLSRGLSHTARQLVFSRHRVSSFVRILNLSAGVLFLAASAAQRFKSVFRAGPYPISHTVVVIVSLTLPLNSLKVSRLKDARVKLKFGMTLPMLKVSNQLHHHNSEMLEFSWS